MKMLHQFNETEAEEFEIKSIIAYSILNRKWRHLEEITNLWLVKTFRSGTGGMDTLTRLRVSLSLCGEMLLIGSTISAWTQ